MSDSEFNSLKIQQKYSKDDFIKDVLPEQKVVILSGPTLAKEVLQGTPTAACVACAKHEYLNAMLLCIHCNYVHE